jgi:F0F1-type ATP synthase membrane subunit b/b'
MSTTYDPIEDKGNQSPSLFGNGLDESDVLLFINSLMEQNSELAEKLEQAESLAKLAMEGAQDAPQQAESAKAEADRIITEAKRTAESYARERVASAEQQAQAMFKAAQEKAESIITTAEDEANRIIHEERQKTESVRWQAKEIVTAAEAKARDVKAQAEGEASKIVLEAKTRAEQEALRIKQEAEQILEKNKDTDNKDEIKETLAAILTQLKGSDGKQPAQVPEQEDINKKEQFALYSGPVELEIPPPLVMGPLTNLAKHLKNTRQIEVLALNSTSNRGLKIRLFLHNPLPLFHILKSMPQVEKVSRGSGRSQGKQSTRSQSGNGSILVTMRK